MANRRRQTWSLIAALCVGVAMVTLVDDQRTVDAAAVNCVNNSDCGCDQQQQQQNCSAGSGAGGTCVQGSCQCNPLHAGLNCEIPFGACCNIPCNAVGQANCASLPCAEISQGECASVGGTYQGNFTSCAPSDPCAVSTPTATATATATPTQTRVPQGGDCVDASQCDPGLFCSDTVCCDTACLGAGQSCDVPGEVGTCVTEPAGAPAASGSGLAIIVALLIATAFFALRARRP